MYTLHHCLTARSFRPLWTLEEIGAAYELIVLPFPPRFLAREFLEVNLLGTVPAFRDGAVFMTESAAICQYLAERHPASGLAVGSDAPGYGDYLNFLHFGEATLTFPQTLVLRYSRFEAPEKRLPQVAEDYSRWFLARLRRVEQVLGERAYMSGGGFTAADISVGYALQLAGMIGLSAQFGPAVGDYWSRLQARPAYRRALEAEQRGARPGTPSPFPAAPGS